ncbi:MAG TPA: hypothetical protein VG937_06820 [Polyangiaceae bacterium]|nr:hypothetical protein [Polyangiaceae bacterium]
MSSRLVPCAECHRHVRVSAEFCPFCSAERPPEARVAEEVPFVPARTGSLAVMTFRAAALGVALNACGGDVEKPKPSAQGGSAAQAGSTATTGGAPDTTAGGTPATGGRSSTGGIELAGGGPNMSSGGAVPIYRATPRG